MDVLQDVVPRDVLQTEVEADHRRLLGEASEQIGPPGEGHDPVAPRLQVVPQHLPDEFVVLQQHDEGWSFLLFPLHHPHHSCGFGGR
jgi:hypothetical protein